MGFQGDRFDVEDFDLLFSKHVQLLLIDSHEIVDNGNDNGLGLE